MKKILIAFVVVATAMACQKNLPSTGTFGDQKITADGATPIKEFVASANAGETPGKVTGTVTKVCQAEGCWFNLDMGDGQYVRIITKDHSFPIPKDASGKTAVAEGVLRKQTVEEDRRKHLAKDAGKSEEEIAKISGPVTEYEFEATGVIIK